MLRHAQIVNHLSDHDWSERLHLTCWFTKVATDRTHQERNDRAASGRGQTAQSVFMGNRSINAFDGRDRLSFRGDKREAGSYMARISR